MGVLEAEGLTEVCSFSPQGVRADPEPRMQSLPGPVTFVARAAARSSCDDRGHFAEELIKIEELTKVP